MKTDIHINRGLFLQKILYSYAFGLLSMKPSFIFTCKGYLLSNAIICRKIKYSTQWIAINAWTLLCILGFCILRNWVSRIIFLKELSFFYGTFKDSSCWMVYTCAVSLVLIACSSYKFDKFLINKYGKFSGFRAIPMIFLQVVQLLSQACCLPLPELWKQLSNATSGLPKVLK